MDSRPMVEEIQPDPEISLKDILVENKDSQKEAPKICLKIPPQLFE